MMYNLAFQIENHAPFSEIKHTRFVGQIIVYNAAVLDTFPKSWSIKSQLGIEGLSKTEVSR